MTLPHQQPPRRRRGVKLWIGHSLAHAAVGGGRNGIARKHAQAFRTGKVLRPGLEFIHEHAPVGASVEVFSKPSIRNPIPALRRRGHAAEGALAGDGHADITVGGRHRPNIGREGSGGTSN